MTRPDFHFIARLTLRTAGRGMSDFTGELRRMLREHGAGDGLVTLFLRHTSASLTIQENADPDVRADLLDALDRLAPQDGPYRHTVEGPDDMPAHIKTVLSGVSLAIPVEAGEPLLGTWQGVYLVEHRARPHRREIVAHFIGSGPKP
ncbi:secondary thiamine-phosphate synthase enzyme YjbQ [Aureimonas populi]|uniref:Secondary thiamine-phosphate synthase enzyme YjbQ n=1 Tax=Aureimonas populi TaxID=1701758 RepID=A0ABW5CIR9_9HYPH|nr:secondary thiamine-phosphate synthase enzyme YjbQ [Aureimonas populi]